METYSIIGKNKQGESGSWEIKAKDMSCLNKTLDERGIQADSINGESLNPLTSWKSFQAKGD